MSMGGPPYCGVFLPGRRLTAHIYITKITDLPLYISTFCMTFLVKGTSLYSILRRLLCVILVKNSKITYHFGESSPRTN